MGTGDPIPICKTEVRKDDLNPMWRPLFLNIQQVKSKDNPLIIDCFNFINTGKHYLIGTVHKSLADLENVHNNQHGENLFLPTLVGQNIDNKIFGSVIFPPYRSRSNFLSLTRIYYLFPQVLYGQLFVDKYSETPQNTFLDYIASGWELNFMVAIDFTASNGNPCLPDSLYYMDPSGRPNVYQKNWNGSLIMDTWRVVSSSVLCDSKDLTQRSGQLKIALKHPHVIQIAQTLKTNGYHVNL